MNVILVIMMICCSVMIGLLEGRSGTINSEQLTARLHKNGCLVYQGSDELGKPKTVATDKNCNQITLNLIEELTRK